MNQLTFLDDSTPEPPRYGAFGRRSEVTAPAVLPPNVHNVDPVSSREAADRLEASGARARHREIVVGLVRRHPGKTACELYELATVAETKELGELQEVRRRLTDAQALGEVRMVGTRRCTVRETTQGVWEPTP